MIPAEKMNAMVADGIQRTVVKERREAILEFARELNEKKVEEVLRFDGSEYDILYYSDFLSVLRNHNITESDLRKEQGV